jgi:hypothetical protein
MPTEFASTFHQKLFAFFFLTFNYLTRIKFYVFPTDYSIKMQNAKKLLSELAFISKTFLPKIPNGFSCMTNNEMPTVFCCNSTQAKIPFLAFLNKKVIMIIRK